MSERIAPTYVRVEFSAAVKREAWARCGGRCEGCGKVLERGKYRYDHTLPARRGGLSDLANCKVLCHDGPTSCDHSKTYTEDLPGVAAAKRYSKNRLPLDIDRPVKKAGKINGRGFAPGHRPMRGGNSFKRKK